MIKKFEEFNLSSIKLINSENFDDYHPILSLEKDLGDGYIDDIKNYCGLIPSHYEGHPPPNSDNWKIFLIKKDNTTIGITGFYKLGMSPKNPNEYWLGWFGILHEYRGSVVSKEATDALIEIIKNENPKFKKLMVYLEQDNYRAKRFYEKIGFKYLSTVDEFCENSNIKKEDYFVIDTIDIVMYKKCE